MRELLLFPAMLCLFLTAKDFTRIDAGTPPSAEYWANLVANALFAAIGVWLTHYALT